MVLVTSREEPREFKFCCNICGGKNRAAREELDREQASCRDCGSSVRTRSLIHLLSSELFGESLPLADFPVSKQIQGLGLSDWIGFAPLLAEKFDYQNTYLHKEPRLDITCVDASVEGRFDFLIASEVFEHVAPPVSQAFENARRLLKDDGVMILTVPYMVRLEATREHFPNLHQYELLLDRDPPVLRNRTRDGRVEIFDDLRFHGGSGSTLEMRLFGRDPLRRELEQAGFRSIKIYDEEYPDFGILWQGPWSLPWAVRP